MMLRYVKVSNPNLFFFPSNNVNVRDFQSSVKHCVVLIQREKEREQTGTTFEKNSIVVQISNQFFATLSTLREGEDKQVWLGV